MIIELAIGAVVGYHVRKALDGRNHVLIRKGSPKVEETLKIKARGFIANLKDAWDEALRKLDEEGR